MNIQKILLSMVLMASVSGIAVLASDADVKSSAAGFRSRLSEQDWKTLNKNLGQDVGPHQAVGWEKMDENHKDFLKKMDDWSERAKELKRGYTYPLRDYRSFSVKDETWNKILVTTVTALVTGVITVSWQWAMTSKEDVQERRAAQKYANLSAHQNQLNVQYAQLNYLRTVAKENREKAAATKDVELRKTLLEQCDLRDKEIQNMQCSLNEAIYNFNKTRSEFLNPGQQPTNPAQDAKQALTLQESAKKPVAAPAA